MTAIDSLSDETIDESSLTRRRVVRGGIAGALALVGIAIGLSGGDVEARRRTKKTPVKSNTTGGNNTGSNGTGTNAGNGSPSTGANNSGTDAGGDTVGTSVVVPPVTGTSTTGQSIRCTTRGAIVDANNPANNRPAEKICVPVP